MPPRTIAIDGPAGSGKSVIGLWLAGTLGYAYLDTGVLYRALTWLAHERGVGISDGAALARLADEASLEVIPPPTADDARGYAVLLDERDVTESLFAPAVNEHVSEVSAHPEVRKAVLPLQRRIAAAGSVVMVGRDIGTVVMPDADLKIYLDASPDVRARRRWAQEKETGRSRTLKDVTADVHNRDETDSSRTTAPLVPADDAIIIKTDSLTLDDEKAQILDLVSRRSTR